MHDLVLETVQRLETLGAAIEGAKHIPVPGNNRIDVVDDDGKIAWSYLVAIDGFMNVKIHETAVL
jgi:hypothetical protein